jgi:hypothetical protein
MKLGRSKLDRKAIEDWLEKSLVPIEPNPEFVRNLRARLVTIRGNQVLSPWMLILVLASVMILIATWFGFGLRILLGLLGLIGMTERKRRQLAAEVVPSDQALAES